MPTCMFAEGSTYSVLFTNNPSFSRCLQYAQGVLDRETSTVHLFERAGRTKKATDMAELDLHDPKLPELITDELHEQLLEDVEMLDA